MQIGPVLPLALPSSSLYGDEIRALDCLNTILRRTRPTMAEIKDVVCDFYQVQPMEIESGTREMLATHARQVFCFFAHRYTRASQKKIGERIGDRDHTTVFHAIRKIELHELTQPQLRDDLNLLRVRIAEKVLQRPRLPEIPHAEAGYYGA